MLQVTYHFIATSVNTMYSVYRHHSAKLNAPGADTYGLRRSVFSAIAFRRMPVPSAGSAGEGQAVLRGSGWNNNALNVRVPNRNRNAPANQNDNIGIRCAKTPRSAGDEYERIEHLMIMLKAGALPALMGAQ